MCNTNTEPPQATAFRVFRFDLHQYTHHHQITHTPTKKTLIAEIINKKERNMFYVVASSQIILYRESLEYTQR